MVFRMNDHPCNYERCQLRPTAERQGGEEDSCLRTGLCGFPATFRWTPCEMGAWPSRPLHAFVMSDARWEQNSHMQKQYTS